MGVITGSDDSTIRRMLFRADKGSMRFTDSAEVGAHAAGTQVRALAAVPQAAAGEFGCMLLARGLLFKTWQPFYLDTCACTQDSVECRLTATSPQQVHLPNGPNPCPTCSSSHRVPLF